MDNAVIERPDYQPSQFTQPVQAVQSEATKIEQTRVAAEVAMQAELAKRYPRNMNLVFQRIEETFTLSPRLVEQSKFSYYRAGTPITGFTIQFARVIAECVGNITYSFKELSRGDQQSEMFVYAWDMETNTMQSRSIIVRHIRDKTNESVPLTKERDIYENNANNAGRRMRECIFGVLPIAAKMKGEEIVDLLLKKAYPKQQVLELIQKKIALFKTIGVSKQNLIKERGNRPTEIWTRNDLFDLTEHYESIENEDKTIHEIFDIKPKGVEIIPEKGRQTTEPEKQKAVDTDVDPFTAKKQAAETACTTEVAQEKLTLSKNVERLKSKYTNPDNTDLFDTLEDKEIIGKHTVQQIFDDNDDSQALKILAACDAELASQ